MCNSHSNHHHHHEHSESKGLKRFTISFVILIFALLLPVNENIKIFMYITAYIISGFDVVYRALRNLLKGDLFDENFLMSIATLGAICLKEFPEAVSVMVLYQLGEFLQHKAVSKSRKSISKLMDIRPEYANIEENGVVVQKHPEEININDVIIVKAGEKVPLDGEVTEGHSFLDTSSLTGESVLREVKEGDNILSGCINTSGFLKIKVNKKYKDSAVSKILELVENASSRKSSAENFIKKFAKYYTPIVVILAVLLILIPFIVFGSEVLNIWLERALTFLVISCPCALVISVPLSFFSALGTASKYGILIKGSNYVEMLSKPQTVVFDKTGTLTKGTFSVTSIIPANGFSQEDLIKYAAYAESYSNHPVAQAVKNAYKKSIDNTSVSDETEIAGNGVCAKIYNHDVLAGNKKLMDKYGINTPESPKDGNVIYIAIDGKFMGFIVISDEIKENAQNAINQLKSINIKTVMLTGDTNQNARNIAEKLNMDEYYSDLLPAGKVSKLEILLSEKDKKRSVIFAGDGINDAPVLMRSDIGIAMGALGSDAAIEAADVVITDDNLSKIYTAVKLAKRTMIIVRQNIIFAIGVKVLFLLLGSVGLMTMWGAVFADVGVTLLAVLNSLRIMKLKSKSL